MRIPPWPLRREPFPESERLRQLRADAEMRAEIPAVVWREAYMLLVARLERSKDPRIKRLSDISFEEAYPLVYRWAADQTRIYDEVLDEMRRLDVSRARPGVLSVWYAFLRCRQVRGRIEQDPIDVKKAALDLQKAVRRAVSQVADELDTTSRSLQAQFSKWRLDPSSDDMIDIPKRDPRPAAFYDFEVVPRARRRGRKRS